MENNGSSWLAAVLTFFGGATVYGLVRSVFNRLMVSSDLMQKRRLDALETAQVRLIEDMRRDRDTLVELVTDVKWMKDKMAETALRSCGPSKPGR